MKWREGARQALIRKPMLHAVAHNFRVVFEPHFEQDAAAGAGVLDAETERCGDLAPAIRVDAARSPYCAGQHL